jgi:hypothetical protein
MAAGIKVFSSLQEAKAAGFLPYDKTPDGYLVRRDDGHSYALALVRIERKTESPASETNAGN